MWTGQVSCFFFVEISLDVPEEEKKAEKFRPSRFTQLRKAFLNIFALETKKRTTVPNSDVEVCYCCHDDKVIDSKM